LEFRGNGKRRQNEERGGNKMEERVRRERERGREGGGYKEEVRGRE
jgi:hypothetical protein